MRKEDQKTYAPLMMGARHLQVSGAIAHSDRHGRQISNGYTPMSRSCCRFLERTTSAYAGPSVKPLLRPHQEHENWDDSTAVLRTSARVSLVAPFEPDKQRRTVLLSTI